VLQSGAPRCSVTPDLGATDGFDVTSKIAKAGQIKRFYEIEQERLMLDFEKITLFTDHPTSLGSFRERRLRQFLKEFTPKQLSVESGFVSTWAPETGRISDSQSKQIDCLIFDSNRRQALLQTDDFVIVEPEAIYAAVEVKSSLSFYHEKSPTGKVNEQYPLSEYDGGGYRWGGTFVEALRNIISLSNIMGPNGAGVFKGIFAYSLNFDWRNVYHAFDNDELQRQLQIEHIDQLPQAICVPGSLFMSLSPHDLFESAPHHDASTSFLNYIGTTETSPAYPLQFFTTFYTNQVNVKLTGRMPDAHGLFSANDATVKIWSHHFDLNSRGYEDQ
jgi:hypothetical protein